MRMRLLVPGPFGLAHVEGVMDKDRVEGIGKKVTGSIKEAIGKVTGDTKLQTEGTAEKAVGKTQNAMGGAKDTVRNAAKT